MIFFAEISLLKLIFFKNQHIRTDLTIFRLLCSVVDRALFTTSLSQEVAQDAATNAPASAKRAVAEKRG